MIQKGLVLITSMIAYTAVVSAYPPIIYAKPEQIHLATGCKYCSSLRYVVLYDSFSLLLCHFDLCGRCGLVDKASGSGVEGPGFES